MLKTVQAFDRAPFAEGDTDDADSLKRKLHAAERVFRDRGSWLKPHQRIAIFRKLAMLGAVIQLNPGTAFGPIRPHGLVRPIAAVGCHWEGRLIVVTSYLSAERPKAVPGFPRDEQRNRCQCH